MLDSRGLELSDYEPLLLSSKEQADEYWSEIKPLLDRCIDRATHGEFNTQDVYNLLLEGKVFIFIVKSDKTIRKSVKLVLVLELAVYPRLTAMNIMALGGTDLEALHEKYWDSLCGWAYMNGVRVIEGMVSPAMKRVISRYGFKPVYTHMRLDLTEKIK
jgi:hypothetical protein